MLVLKPYRQGEPVELDSNQDSKDIQDLAALEGAALIPAVDFGSPANGNPDGVTGAGKLRPVPGVLTRPR